MLLAQVNSKTLACAGNGSPTQAAGLDLFLRPEFERTNLDGSAVSTSKAFLGTETAFRDAELVQAYSLDEFTHCRTQDWFCLAPSE
jgi:hypothetical protein